MFRKAFCLVVISWLTGTVQAQENIFVGVWTKDAPDKMYIGADFGIEQWEDGKRTTHRFQKWHLSCSHDPSLPFKTWCSLERLVIDGDLTGRGTKHISEHNHYIEEKTLQITNADLINGKLDFKITLTDRNVIDVMMRFKSKPDGFTYLEGFKALGVARGVFTDSMTAVEYRIPEYTYVLNAPIELPGFSSQDDKVLHDFERSLNAADLAIWKTKSKTLLNDNELKLNEAILKAQIPDVDKILNKDRKATEREAALIADSMFRGVPEWIRTSGLSGDGQTKVQALMKVVREMTIQNILK